MLHFGGICRSQQSKTVWESRIRSLDSGTHSSLFHLFLCLSVFTVWRSRKHDLECCHLVPSSLHRWRHKPGGQGVWGKALTSQCRQIFFCFSLVNMSCLHAPLKFEAKVTFLWLYKILHKCDCYSVEFNFIYNFYQIRSKRDLLVII